MDDIFEEIRAERRRQDEKWGEQNHSMLHQGYSQFWDEVISKQLTSTRKRIERGNFGWFDILLEEFCEAFLEKEEEGQRKEMIQVAAVAVEIIESLDRKKKKREKNVK